MTKRIWSIGVAVLLSTVIGVGIAVFSPFSKGLIPQRLEQLTLQKDFPSLTGQYLSASLARNAGDARQALDHLNEAIGLNPDANKDLYVDAYGLALSAGDIKLAEHFAQKIQENGGEGLDEVVLSPSLLQGVVALKKGDFALAEQKLSHAPENGFGQMVVSLLQAWALQAQGKPFNEEQVLAFTEQGGEFNLLLDYELALLFDAAGKDAANYFENLAEIPQLPLPMAISVMQYYQKKGDTSRVEALLKIYTERTGITLTADQLPPLKMTAVQGASAVFYGISSMLVSLNVLEMAEIPLNLADYLTQDDASVALLRGQIAERKGNSEQAIKEYKKLENNPYFGLSAALQLAYLYQDNNDAAAALAQVNGLLKNHKDKLSVWLAQGDILRGQSKFEEAVDAYSAGINTLAQKKTEHWPAFYARAVAYERAGQWNKAEADFLEALRLQPDQPDVLNYLGYSWLMQNHKVEQATAMIEKAISARPQDAHIIDSMGWAYYHLKQYDKAVYFLEQALDLAPQDATVNEHLGDAYWQLGDTTQAHYQWERALGFNPTEVGQKEGLEAKLANGLPAVDAATPLAGGAGDHNDQQRADANAAVAEPKKLP